jgi:DNA-binding transcriptional LysR family regulator
MPAPDLADLDAFTEVARARSFRRAAALRGTSASGLSEAVRRLESRLGVRLLNRTTRSVTPTEAGQRLLQRLAPALTEVTAALDAINDDRNTPTGTLRLNVPVIVARAILPPMIGPFLAAHPGITLEIVAEDNFIDVLAAGFDAGIRYDERLERDMIAIPIGPRTQRFAGAASPAYLRRHGHPAHPNDLLRHACIRHRFASGITPPWEFERAGQTVRIAPSGPVVANIIEVELQAAIDGLGIIFTFEDFLAPALARGDLQPVLQDWWQTFSGPRLYYPSRTHMPAPLRAFVDYAQSFHGLAPLHAG